VLWFDRPLAALSLARPGRQGRGICPRAHRHRCYGAAARVDEPGVIAL